VNIDSYLDHVLATRASPPAMFQAPAWNPPGPKKTTWPAILRRTFDARGRGNPRAYELELSRRRHAALATALGLERKDDRLFLCTSPRHIPLLACFAHEATDARVAEDFPDLLTLFRHNRSAAVIPCSPALDWSPSSGAFIFLGGPAYSPYLRDAGWFEDPATGFYVTEEPWRAAAYARQATPAALQRLEASGLGDRHLRAYTRQPVHGAFMAPTPDMQKLIIFAGNDDLCRTMIAHGLPYDPVNNAYLAYTVGQARPLVGLLHPQYKTIGARLTSGSALIDTDNTSIRDLIAIAESEDVRKGGGAKKDAPPVQMSYHAERGVWRTTDAEAGLAAGFVHAAQGLFETDRLDDALKLRAVADMASELAIEVALAKRYADEIATRTPLPVPAPPPGESYSEEQIEALQFLSVRPHVLVADDMGLGKTLIGTGAIEMLRPKYCLIVCMPQSIEAWVRHIEKWALHRPDIHIANAESVIRPGITIISDAVLSRAQHIKAHRWGLGIFDEVHRFKSDDSARAAALYDPAAGIEAERTIDLTGTPIPNRPQDLFNLLHHKLPEIFHSRDTFKKLYGVEDLEKSVVDLAAGRRRRTLGAILRQTIMIRRLKKMPVTKTRKTIAFEIDNPALVANLAAEKATLQAYETAKRTVDKTRILAELNRLRCETSLHKVPFVAKLVADLIAEGNTPLIFAHHHVVIDALSEELGRLGFDFAKIHGGATSASQRQKIVDQFQAGNHHGLLAGIKSGGTSLTITRANLVVFIEIDWTPYDLVQAEDRAYRRGQLNDVLVIYVVIKNSVDSHVANVNNLKIRIASEILDPLPDELAAAIAA